MPYGGVSAALVLQLVAMEAGVHADDLASAAGWDEPLEPDLVRATAVVLEAALPTLALGAAERPPAGTSIALSGRTVDLRFTVVGKGWVSDRTAPITGGVIGGDDSAVLRFALGRAGLDERVLTAVGDPDVAQRFKLWFPGP